MNLNLNNQIFNAGIYIRLSREDGDKLESESITNQRNIILSYIKENGYSFYKEYVDDGYSGTNFDRPAFNEMLKDIENKKINMIITKDLSRFGRDYIKTGYYIENYFPENMIRYISILDNIDTFIDGTHNDIMPFKSLLNDMYAKDISKKIKSVLTNKKKNGQYMSTCTPYGFIKDINGKGTLCVDESVRNVIVKIFDMFVSGVPIYSIGKILTDEGIETPAIHNNINVGVKSQNFGKWNLTTLKKILSNELYIGHTVQGKTKKINYKSKKRVPQDKSAFIIVENTHEPIISKEVFDSAQKLLEAMKNNKTRKHEYLLKGLLYCEHCNTKLLLKVDKEVYKDRTTIRHYIYCYRRGRYKDDHKVVLRYDYLEKEILDKIKKILKRYIDKKKLVMIAKMVDNNEKNIQNMQKQIELFKNQLSKITSQQKILYEDRLNGIINLDEYKRFSEPIIEEKEKLENNIQTIENDIKTLKANSNEINIDDKEIEKTVNEFLKLDKPDKSLLLKLVNKITVNKKKEVKIYFNFNQLNLLTNVGRNK